MQRRVNRYAVVTRKMFPVKFDSPEREARLRHWFNDNISGELFPTPCEQSLFSFEGKRFSRTVNYTEWFFRFNSSRLGTAPPLFRE